MKTLVLLLGIAAYATAQFVDAVIPPSMAACGQKCINDVFHNATTKMGCGVDKFQCYCTKMEFYTGLGACSHACGEDTDLDVSEWRNIFCQAGAGAPNYTVPIDPAATTSVAPSERPIPTIIVTPKPEPDFLPLVGSTPSAETPAPVVSQAPSIPKAPVKGIPKGPERGIPKGPAKGPVKGPVKGPFAKGVGAKGPGSADDMF